MSVDLTPLAGGPVTVNAGAPARLLQTTVAINGGTYAMPDAGTDGMLILSSVAALNVVTVSLPITGENLLMMGLCSMQDIATINFTNGTVLNPPAELLANQAILLQRIDKANNKWITL